MEEIKIKKIRPLNNVIITTMNKYTADIKVGEVLDVSKLEGSVKRYQTVIAIGPMVRDIKVGDVVFINPSRYYNPEYVEEKNSLKGTVKMRNLAKYQIPTIKLNGENCYYITSQDIEFVIEDFEE